MFKKCEQIRLLYTVKKNITKLQELLITFLNHKWPSILWSDTWPPIIRAVVLCHVGSSRHFNFRFDMTQKDDMKLTTRRLCSYTRRGGFHVRVAVKFCN